MAEDKKVTISRTLNGDTIYYIARNSSGTVFARALTLKELEAAIKTYKEPPPVEEEEKEEKHLPGEVAPAAHLEGETEPKKKFLTNKLARVVQKRKKVSEHLPVESKKKSFWDKLK